MRKPGEHTRRGERQVQRSWGTNALRMLEIQRTGQQYRALPARITLLPQIDQKLLGCRDPLRPPASPPTWMGHPFVHSVELDSMGRLIAPWCHRQPLTSLIKAKQGQRTLLGRGGAHRECAGKPTWKGPGP